jgi:acetolactate synthase small subunit
MKAPPLWKVVVKRRLEMAEVMLIADEVPDVTDAAAEIRGVELQRIDTSRDRTVIFVTASPESARAFAATLKGSEKDIPRYAEASPDELMARELVVE